PANAVTETLQVVLVMGHRVRLAMAGRVVEEEIADHRDGVGRGRRKLARVGHEPTKSPISFLFVVAALDQFDLFAFPALVGLSVPPAVEFAKERLARHCSVPLRPCLKPRRAARFADRSPSS